MRVVFTCGGTGGHINPALSVAKLVRSKHPEAEILFIGAAGGMETRLVPREGFEIKTVDVSNLRRSIKPKDIANNFGTVFGLARSVRQAEEILKGFRPDVVVGTGGYASFPTIRAAEKLGIPSAIHESNAIPGLTTKLLADSATRIMVSFEDSIGRYRNPERVTVTGTPVREEFIFTKKEDARRELGIGEKPLVVSYWGSLGAREMNKKIAQFMLLESKRDKFFHIHATGSYGWRWMPDYVREMGIKLEEHPNIHMREYIYDMPRVMAAADIVICRGGASTLSEVIASATPAIIVPSPNVAGNHQEKNARAIEAKNGAVVILEKDCDGHVLMDAVSGLLSDGKRMRDIENNLKSMAVLDSAERIYSVISELAAVNVG